MHTKFTPKNHGAKHTFFPLIQRESNSGQKRKTIVLLGDRACGTNPKDMLDFVKS